LRSLPVEPGTFGRELADVFQSLLRPPVGAVRLFINNLDHRRAWMRDFLNDAPEWDPYLRAWIRRMKDAPDPRDT
jgi:hypothetical protein